MMKFAARFLLVAVIAIAGLSCGDEEDDVGGGGCEDGYDLILKGEVEDYDNNLDVDFKAKFDVRDNAAAVGEVKFDGDWYDIAEAEVTNDDAAFVFAIEGADLTQQCEDPETALGIFLLFDVTSDNGLAGPFEGQARAICGPEFASGETIAAFDVESEVTCEDL